MTRHHLAADLPGFMSAGSIADIARKMHDAGDPRDPERSLRHTVGKLLKQAGGHKSSQNMCAIADAAGCSVGDLVRWLAGAAATPPESPSPPPRPQKPGPSKP